MALNFVFNFVRLSKSGALFDISSRCVSIGRYQLIHQWRNLHAAVCAGFAPDFERRTGSARLASLRERHPSAGDEHD